MKLRDYGMKKYVLQRRKCLLFISDGIRLEHYSKEQQSTVHIST